MWELRLLECDREPAYLSILWCESRSGCCGRKRQLDSPASQVGFIVHTSQCTDMLKDIVLVLILKWVHWRKL